MLRKVGLILIFILLGGSLFLVFDVEAAALMNLLVVLLIVQVNFFLKRIRLKAPAPLEIDPQQVAGVLKNIAQAKAKAQTAKPAPAPAPEEEPRSAGDGELEGSITPNLFSQFQKNLESSVQKAPAPKPGLKGDEEVVLQLTGKSSPPKAQATQPKATPAAPSKAAPLPKPRRNPYAPTKPLETASKPTPAAQEPPVKQAQKEALENNLIDQIPTEPLGELFEGMEENSATEAPAKVLPRQRKKPAELQIKTPPTPPAEKAATKASPKEKAPLEKRPLEAHELLTSEDLQQEKPDPAKEGELIFQAAQIAFDQQQFDQCQQSIEGYLAAEGEKDKKWLKKVKELLSETHYAKGDHQGYLHQVQQRLKSHKKGSAPYLKLLEKTMDRYSRLDQQELALPFFLTAMKEYAAKKDHQRLDVTYYHLEEAYRRLDEPENLLKTFENHLSVKKLIQDQAGQLPLLDQMGKIYYDRGDQEGSKRTYELAVEIRTQLEAE